MKLDRDFVKSILKDILMGLAVIIPVLKTLCFKVLTIRLKFSTLILKSHLDFSPWVRGR